MLWLVLFAALDLGTGLPGDLPAFLPFPAVVPFLVSGTVLHERYVDRETWVGATSLPERVAKGVTVAVVSGVVGVPVGLALDAVLPAFLGLFVAFVVESVVGMAVTFRLLRAYVDGEAVRAPSRWPSSE